ncbi:MAG TPA: glucosamine-6-phosphate deaminase [Bacteroidales bacterium]|nr:glucosamine-6-phosphate deaminase [Bacteroidales bacterium]HPJ59286.1 glucosamine-6-phosphate deaminase [Bacteroidales bacterium]
MFVIRGSKNDKDKDMELIISDSTKEMGVKAAMTGALLIRKAVSVRGTANIIVATGASQFEMLAALVKEKIDWPKVTAFHLDEYIGLPESHPASFRKYLRERFAGLVPLKEFHYVNGEGNPAEECRRLGDLIREHPVDVAFVGIGENGHLAFNDPPADFDTEEPYIVVNLDEACRKQQLGEGWFASLREVPMQAISMSIRQIMKSKAIICTVPDQRKAEAVRQTLNDPVSPQIPASILRHHHNAWLFLDKESASLL